MLGTIFQCECTQVLIQLALVLQSDIECIDTCSSFRHRGIYTALMRPICGAQGTSHRQKLRTCKNFLRKRIFKNQPIFVTEPLWKNLAFEPILGNALSVNELMIFFFIKNRRLLEQFMLNSTCHKSYVKFGMCHKLYVVYDICLVLSQSTVVRASPY